MAASDLTVTVWATTLGADLLTLCRYLDKREEVELTVFMNHPASFRREAVWQLDPLQSPLFDRNLLAYPRAWRRYSDITIVDNGVPLLKTSRNLFVLWHGFGWKGPDDREAFAFMQRCIANWWGDATQPNDHLVWQCFGPWDRTFRDQVSGFHRDNLAVLGSAFHDDIRVPVDKTRVARFYPFDILRRKTLLLASTWHYGGVFSQWGSEFELFDRLVGWLESRDTNLIVRMHDRWRYDSSYLSQMKRLARRHPNVFIKFKNQHQDNTVDLKVADILLTNFSSIANYFYATGRPTVHIYPVEDPDQPYLLRRVWLGRVKKIPIPNVKVMWKLSPEENGGLVARSPEDLFECIQQALDEPDCCRAKSRQFLDTYMLGADGNSCQRIMKALRDLADKRS